MPNEKSEKIITISFQKAMAILAGAILSSIAGTIVTTATVLNSDHFAIINNAEAIGVLEETCVNKEGYEIQLKHINDKLEDLQGSFKEVMKLLSN